MRTRASLWDGTGLEGVSRANMRNTVDPAEESGLCFKRRALSRQLRKGGISIPPSWLLSEDVSHQTLATGLAPTSHKLPRELDA